MTKYIRFKKLLEQYVPVNRVTIWNWVKAGTFPAPIQLNPHVVNSPLVWSEDEILAWLETRPRGFGPVNPGVDPDRRRAVIRQRKLAAQGIGHNGGPKLAAPEAKAGRTKPNRFTRRAPIPVAKANRFTRGNCS